MTRAKLKLKDYPFPPFKGIEVSSCLFNVHPEADVNGWLVRAFSWMYAYHHEEAIFCFQQAKDLVDNGLCPLASWGIAYCHIPNYNNTDVNQENQEKFPSFTVAKREAKNAMEMLPLFEENFCNAAD